MSDLVGNPEDRFSRVEAHIIQMSITIVLPKYRPVIKIAVLDIGSLKYPRYGCFIQITVLLCSTAMACVQFCHGTRVARFKQDANLNVVEPRHGKTYAVVSEQVRHKPSCTSTADG